MKRTLQSASFATSEELWEFFAAHKLEPKHVCSFYADGLYHLVW